MDNLSGPFIRLDAVNAIIKETPPRCFHCGSEYIKDFKYCSEVTNTWMPGCDCIKRTVRIVTGYPVVFDSYRVGDDDES